MASKNHKATAVIEKKHTHGGAIASAYIGKNEELERAVASCLLWEDQFYESGSSIASRIEALVGQCDPNFVCDLAIRARNCYNLRHVGLFLIATFEREFKKHSVKHRIADVLFNIIQRPDELTEYLALYWKDKKPGGKHTPPLTAQAKKGLANAFAKFDAYQLGKYNNTDKSYKLKDVYRLVHPTTQNAMQFGVWKRLLAGALESPDTWEVSLSAGKGKKETFERLMSEHKLGAMAILRNLRNMEQAGVERKVVEAALDAAKVERILPFRFIAAAKHNPKWESAIEKAMLKNLASVDKLPGKTALVIDVSGSMSAPLGGKSELDRMEAAFALSILIREVCEEAVIYVTAGNDCTRIHQTEIVPDRHGFALADTMRRMYDRMGGGGIFLTQCMDYVHKHENGKADRVFILTDEQDCSGPDAKLSPEKAKAFGKYNYICNVSSYECGIAYRKFVHINGFSERVVDFIRAYETNTNLQFK